MPNFFMPPQELEQTMRALRAAALSRPRPRTLEPPTSISIETAPVIIQKREQHVHALPSDGSVHVAGPSSVPPTERDRIARIFASSTT